MSRLARSRHLGPALGALALVVAAIALVVTLTRGDPKAPDLAKRIVYVSNVTLRTTPATRRSARTARAAPCSSGAVRPSSTAASRRSVAMYQGYAVANGWEVQAHMTNPPKRTRFPNWDLFSVAICLRT